MHSLAESARPLGSSNDAPGAPAWPLTGIRTGCWGTVLLLMVSLLVWSPTSRALGLTGMDFADEGGGRVSIRLQFDEPPPAPESFRIQNPARIAWDFNGVVNQLTPRSQTIDIGAVRSLNTVEAGGRTRVVLNLSNMRSYETERADNTFIISVAAPGEVAPAGGAGTGDRYEAAAEQGPAETVAESSPQRSRPADNGTGQEARSTPASPEATEVASGTPRRAIENVDFRRGDTGQGQVVMELGTERLSPSIERREGNLEVRFSDTALPPDERVRLDVLDFATPVSYIDVFREGETAIVAIETNRPFEHLAYQVGPRFVVEVKDPEPEKPEDVQEQLFEEKDFEGDKLSLNFQNIEVRSVLQLIADFTDLNIVVADSVSGNITLRLKEVPWDLALEIILKAKGLSKRENQNVIWVAPTSEIAEQEQKLRQLRLENQRSAPLQTEFIQVNFAEATNLETLIEERGQGTGTGDDRNRSAVLSSRGTVAVDQRTNKLIVTDTEEQLRRVRALVDELDRPVKQVLIESRIVVANDGYSRDLGVRLGGVVARDNGDGVTTLSGSSEAADTVVNSAADNLGSTGSPFPVEIPALEDRTAVDFPVGGGQLGLAILDSNFLLDLELSALQAEGRGEIISTPRVITSNGSQASIEQGEQIPFQTVSQDGTQTEFQDATLEVNVTPQITPDDRVLMDLEVSQDSRGEATPDGLAINTRSVTTQVLVRNGETVVLGGVYEETRRRDEQKVPFLGDIPILGALFRNRRDVLDKVELLIFVTPRIIDENTASGDQL